MIKRPSNFAFEADAVKRHTVSCRVRAPRGLTQVLGITESVKELACPQYQKIVARASS